MNKKIIFPAIGALALLAAGGVLFKLHKPGVTPAAPRPAPVIATAAAPGAKKAFPLPPSAYWRPIGPDPKPGAPNPNLLAPPTFKARFSGPLPFKEIKSSPRWSYGTVKDLPAFRDNGLGMIWGPRLKLAAPTPTVPDVKKAMEACAALPPAGAWALPTMPEFERGGMDNLPAVDGDAHHLWLTYSEGRLFITPGSYAWDNSRPKEKLYSVRCVGRAQ